MDINEARKRLPIFASLDDQSFVDVVHRKYYADMDKAEFSKWLGVKQKAQIQKIIFGR
jgi:hypothetical protein